MNIHMQIVCNSFDKEDGIYPFCLGNLILHNDNEQFAEVFYMALDFWSMVDYEYQWGKGIERLKDYKQSCLVASIQHSDMALSLINWWLLYKTADGIVIRNQLLAGKDLAEVVGLAEFSPETCYDFIPPYREIISEMTLRPSEWRIPLKNLLEHAN